MNNRPIILKGNINLRNKEEAIIGKIIKNKNVEKKENYIQILDKKNINLFQEGYKAYIFEEIPKNIKVEELNYCVNIQDYQTLIDYDVIEIINHKLIRVLYRDDSEDNAIVVTNQCNSNCIMCPDSDAVRNTKENPDIKKLVEQVQCIPDDTKHITITGGEPRTIKTRFIKIIRRV